MPGCQVALGDQLFIGLKHGVARERKIRREGARGGKLLSRTKPRGEDTFADCLGEPLICRRLALFAEINHNVHWIQRSNKNWHRGRYQFSTITEVRWVGRAVALVR